MFAYVFQVHFDTFRTMGWVVNFDPINRYISTQLIQQREVIEGKAAFPPTRMRDQANSTAPMHHLDCFSHIHPGSIVARLTNDLHSCRPIWSITMFTQQESVIQRMEKLSIV